MTSFINALASFVFDTAIGKTWSLFVRRLVRLKTESQSGRAAAPGQATSPQTEGEEQASGEEGDDDHEEDNDDQTCELKSIFSLAVYHGAVLDRILVACFLRTKRAPLLFSFPSPSHSRLTDSLSARGSRHPERPVQKLLTRVFTSVLDLGKLVRDVQYGTLTEEAGAFKLVEIHDAFEVQSLPSLRSLLAAFPGYSLMLFRPFIAKQSASRRFVRWPPPSSS